MEVLSILSIIIAAASFYIARSALRLQQEEVRKNSQLNSYIQVSALLQNRIDTQETLIGKLKEQGKNCTGLIKRVNSELKPLQNDINGKLVELMVEENPNLNASGIHRALKNIAPDKERE